LFSAYLLTSNQELILVAPAILLLVLLGDQNLGRDLLLLSTLLTLITWVGNRLGLFHLFDYYSLWNVTCRLLFLFVAVAVVVITITRTRRLGSEWKLAGLCAAALLLGLGCYFYLPITSMTNPPTNWGYPRTVEGFFHLITRGQYERPHPTDDLARFMAQLWDVAKQTGGSFGWLYVPFAVLPFCLLRQAERRARNWLVGSVAVFLCAGPLMVAMLNPPGDLGSLQLIGPFLCAMDIVLAIWIGLGLMVIGGLVGKRGMRPGC